MSNTRVIKGVAGSQEEGIAAAMAQQEAQQKEQRRIMLLQGERQRVETGLQYNMAQLRTEMAEKQAAITRLEQEILDLRIRWMDEDLRRSKGDAE